MQVRVTVGVCALVMVPLASCAGGGDAGSGGFALRDSAGIQIAESAAPMWKEGEGWRIAAEPSLEIGVVDGAPEYQLDQVMTAWKRTDGKIVIVDRTSQTIRVFDGSGRHLRTSGGKGGGPGEFQALSWLHLLPGDSLMAYDAAVRRLSIFDPEGNLTSTRTLEFTGLSGPRAAGAFGDGTLLVISRPESGPGLPKTGVRRDSTFYLRASPDGAPLNPIVHQLGQENYIKTGDGYAVFNSLIFGRSSQYALTSERLYAGETDRYEIGVYDPSGRLQRIIRLQRPVRPVAEEDVQTVRSRQRATKGAPSLVRETRKSMVEEMPVPPTMPAFASLETDAARNLWVKEYPGAADPDAPSRWDVFDPDGRMLGALSMPGRFRVTQIGSDYVLGVWKDDLDVEHVRLYPLEKPA